MSEWIHFIYWLRQFFQIFIPSSSQVGQENVNIRHHRNSLFFVASNIYMLMNEWMN